MAHMYKRLLYVIFDIQSSVTTSKVQRNDQICTFLYLQYSDTPVNSKRELKLKKIEHFKMIARKLSPELQKVAETELGENSSKLEKDLEYIRKWLSKQPHLNSRTDDQYLISFLRGCKFSLQRTQEKLDYYYTTKTIVTDLFLNRDPYNTDIQEVLLSGPVLPLPMTASPAGPRIVLLQSSVLNPDNIQYYVFMKVFLMILDVLLQEDDNFTVAGVIFWSESANSSMRFLMQLTPVLLKKMHEIMQNAYPVRLKGFYCTHCPQIAETLFNLSKSLSSEKLAKRMFLYNQINEEFCKQIPKNLHPVDFGGENGLLSDLRKIWKEKVESYRMWFLDDMKYGTQEQLRVGKLTNSADMFRVEGTFKKLDTD